MATQPSHKNFIRVPNALALERYQSSIRAQQKTTDTEMRHAIDAFQNQLARIGFGQPNLTEGAAYPLTRLSRNYILMQSLYRSNWIARKVIDCISEDMTKNWISFITAMDP